MPSFVSFCRRVIDFPLTQAQTVLARVAFDGWQPDQLNATEKPIALELFGGALYIPRSARSILVLRMGRISGKTSLAAAHGLYRMVTADLSLAKGGFPPACLIISPHRETSSVALQTALGMVRDSPYLAPMLVAESRTRFVLERPDGRQVTFASVAKSAGGKTARGFWVIEALLDESEFVASSNPTKVVTDSDILRAIRPRLMPGGQIVLASTPWPAASKTSEYFDSNFGKPENALACRAPTLTMRRGDPLYPEIWEIVRSERAHDANNALREFDCLPTDVEGCFFESSTVDKAVSHSIQPAREMTSGGIDLAFKTDSSALVIVERREGKLWVIYVEMVSPKGAPLIPSEVLTGFVKTAKTYQVRELSSDSHYIETAREHANAVGISMASGPPGSKGKDQAMLYLRDLLRSDKIVLPNNQQLVSQLKSVLSAPTSGGGLGIVFPRVSGSGHADIVAALCVRCIQTGRSTAPSGATSPVWFRARSRRASTEAAGSGQGRREATP